MLKTVILRVLADFGAYLAVEVGNANSQVVRVEIDAERKKAVGVEFERSRWLAPAADGTGFVGFPDSANLPVYIIGTEVPVPGGASHAVDHLDVTDPAAARRTFDVHSRSFAKRGLEAAFERVIGLVVQPGVEFGNANVIAYAPDWAKSLSHALSDMPNIVFEAHSTDYQTNQGRHAQHGLDRQGAIIDGVYQ
jgi:tagatose-1,6-bisphosphate aldolase non-catalytic subunit AgaZ/GatZ